MQPHGLAARDHRHTIFAQWILRTLLVEQNAGSGLLDVAGGKGHLSHALRELGVPCTLVDPCAGSGRRTSSGFFGNSGTRHSSVTSAQDPSEAAGALPATRDTRDLTLQQLLEMEPEMVTGCQAIVGLHPDEATEALVDIALAHQRAFAVLPCCVLPQLFDERRLKSGVRVKKYGSFCQYLREKSGRIRSAELPFAGRNTVLFMTATDYSAPPPPALLRPSDHVPCALAARAGDLARLQSLRAEGRPWDEEVCRCAAWHGHLDVLQWAWQQGCPWNWSAVLDAAMRAPQAHVAAWARDMEPALSGEFCTP